MKTTWWIMVLMVLALVALMFGIGGQLPGFVGGAFTLAAIFFFLFLAGLLFDGAMHVLQTLHTH
jgi:hypothetical protein